MPFVAHIPAVSDLSVDVATALSIALLALVCLLAGLVAHTLIAQRFVNALESSVLSKFPAYEYLKHLPAPTMPIFIPFLPYRCRSFIPARWRMANSRRERMRPRRIAVGNRAQRRA